jgi:hypothetical protein
VRAAVAGGSLAGVRDDRRQRLERALDEIEPLSHVAMVRSPISVLNDS